jgi:hypothetical protein
MATSCPACGCLREGGLRLAVCGDPACCCRKINARANLERMAAEVSAAFQARDLGAFGALLADDARWGDDSASTRCRSRSEVIDTFRRQLSAGVEGQVSALEVGPAGILCRLAFTSSGGGAGARRGTVFHLYRVRGEKIAEIVPFADRGPAVAALGAGRRGGRERGRRS